MFRKSAIFACLCLCLLLLSGIASAKTLTLNAADIDNVTTAANVSLNRNYVVEDAHLASKTVGEPAHSCTGATGPSVWFKVKVSVPVVAYMHTLGTQFSYSDANAAFANDTVMSLYSIDNGTPVSYGALMPVSCNDNHANQANSPQSSLAHHMEPGKTYFVQVSAFLTTQPFSGSVIKLTMTALSLMQNISVMGDTLAPSLNQAFDSWKLSGAGVADDFLNCVHNSMGDLCAFTMQNSALGASKLKQVIPVMKGVKFDVGSTLELSAKAYVTGAQNVKFKVTAVYTDGTTDTTSVTLLDSFPNGAPIEVPVVVDKLTIEKPLAKIVVTILNRETGAGTLTVDNTRLLVIPAPDAAPFAAQVLPVPAAPAR